ncbi:hypothetical protein BH11ACT6_BH11ACT6_17500 [soil metagenome]
MKDSCCNDAKGVLALADRERVISVPSIGDAVVLLLIEENTYDLPALIAISDSGARSLMA